MHITRLIKGHVAQWIEHVATNYGVGGSTPSLPIVSFIFYFFLLLYRLYSIQWGVAKW
jgi:hypothetical protein